MGGGNAPIRPWARAQPNPVRPGVAPVQMTHRPPEPLVPNVTDPQTFRAMRGFLTAANGDGRSRMVKEFTQSSLGLGDEDKELKGGVCAAISMQWIAKSASSEEFWNYIATDTGKANTMALQRRVQQPVKAMKAVNDVALAKVGEFSPQKFKALPTQDERARFLSEAKAVPVKLGEERAWVYSLNNDFRKNHLAESKARLVRSGEPVEYHSIIDACDAMAGFKGYVYISVTGPEASHGIAGYFGDQVRIMDPNHGEIRVKDKIAAACGLEDHISDLAQTLLGGLEKVSVDFYPFAQIPGRLESTVSLDQLDSPPQGEESVTVVQPSTSQSDVIQNSNN